MSFFNTAVERSINHEVGGTGDGYVNDPQDPGKETKFGISSKAYPDIDIKKLTRERAKSIYFTEYWDKIDGEELPPGLAFQLLDFAIHSGTKTAIRFLQKILNVEDDGIMGPRTHKAIKDRNADLDLCIMLLATRLRYLTNLPNWSHAGKGWARRISDNLVFATMDTI